MENSTILKALIYIAGFIISVRVVVFLLFENYPHKPFAIILAIILIYLLLPKNSLNESDPIDVSKNQFNLPPELRHNYLRIVKKYGFVIIAIISVIFYFGRLRFVNNTTQIVNTPLPGASRQNQNNQTQKQNTKEKKVPASYYISKAKKEYSAGNYEKAISLWETSLAHDSKHPELVYHDIGLSYLQLDDLDAAKKALDKSLEIKPTCWAYKLLGEIHYQERDYRSAKEDYQNALDSNNKCTPQEMNAISSKINNLQKGVYREKM